VGLHALQEMGVNRILDQMTSKSVYLSQSMAKYHAPRKTKIKVELRLGYHVVQQNLKIQNPAQSKLQDLSLT
jgi:hypothetical protein